MSVEMTRFKPRELPADERVVELVSALKNIHREEPLADDDTRAVIRRVKNTASEHGLGRELTVFRGELSTTGVGADHLWFVWRDCVIDPNYPLNHEDFLEAFRNFAYTYPADLTIGETAVNDLVDISRRTSIEDRVWGLYPDRYTYIGAPVWGSGNRS